MFIVKKSELLGNDTITKGDLLYLHSGLKKSLISYSSFGLILVFWHVSKLLEFEDFAILSELKETKASEFCADSIFSLGFLAYWWYEHKYLNKRIFLDFQVVELMKDNNLASNVFLLHSEKFAIFETLIRFNSLSGTANRVAFFNYISLSKDSSWLFGAREQFNVLSAKDKLAAGQFVIDNCNFKSFYDYSCLVEFFAVEFNWSIVIS